MHYRFFLGNNIERTNRTKKFLLIKQITTITNKYQSCVSRLFKSKVKTSPPSPALPTQKLGFVLFALEAIGEVQVKNSSGTLLRSPGILF